ncbi:MULTISPECIES: plasmid mobilization relaxosome protein MobC [Pseudomonadota]|uniref:plasmid mobilization relaxosome protein MobC n=1 Tax=Pseudomonadota TaxID=1224 RepID=UPI0006C031C0|nr:MULTISPECIES: plasmid mobilization relaxosome protein MobC [Pseudomonadota]QKI75193.1 plasmid mobilization relaxosome protein MobC [Achromobacter xylosoxidans]CUI33390.1 Bacterial mobilisation protein (MobC) [Achromobacter xylosoxidans]
MKQKTTLSIRLDGDLKRRWQELCLRQGSNSSDGLRQVIVRLLNGSATHTSPTPSAHEQPDTSRRRLELRLTDTECARIETLASQQGMSANRWVIHLIRANLSGEPQFGMTELRTLGESNSRLLAIGRNLNQIARHMNAGHPLEMAITADRIETLTRHIKAHTARVADIMRANIDRWRLE